MKHHKITLIIIMVVVFTLSNVMAASACNLSPFNGQWTTTSTSGAVLGLRITNRSLWYSTSSVSTCANGPAKGTGTIRPNGWSFNSKITLHCTSSNASGGSFGFSATYNGGPKTLTDNFGNTWHRVTH